MGGDSLNGFTIVTLAVNVPGPVAASRLRQLGAELVKVEPPGGDPLAQLCPRWYREMIEGQRIASLDLKGENDRAELESLLARSDLLLTSMRPAALARLSLDWSGLHRRHPRLCHVAIIGSSPPDENKAGHDLTYQASAGLIDPPNMPRTLIADLAGAEKAVASALALLLARERGQGAGYARVSLTDVALEFAAPLRHRVTASGGILGGARPEYNLYQTKDGHIALAALEPHFQERLSAELGLSQLEFAELKNIFSSKSTAEWKRWANARDLPLIAV
ncbi:MAG TPA: CoA transferase [Burkholderiales bacterium]|nr:CoA transferase [Burkholderiales bacterium]